MIYLIVISTGYCQDLHIYHSTERKYLSVRIIQWDPTGNIHSVVVITNGSTVVVFILRTAYVLIK